MGATSGPSFVSEAGEVIRGRVRIVAVFCSFQSRLIFVDCNLPSGGYFKFSSGAFFTVEIDSIAEKSDYSVFWCGISGAGDPYGTCVCVREQVNGASCLMSVMGRIPSCMRTLMDNPASVTFTFLPCDQVVSAVGLRVALETI